MSELTTLRAYVAQAFIYKLLLRILVTANARDHVSQRFLKQPHRRRLRLVRRAQRSESRHPRARPSRHREPRTAASRFVRDSFATPRSRSLAIALVFAIPDARRFARSSRVVDRPSRVVDRPSRASSVSRARLDRRVRARASRSTRRRLARARARPGRATAHAIRYRPLYAPNIRCIITYTRSSDSHVWKDANDARARERRRDAATARAAGLYSKPLYIAFRPLQYVKHTHI